MSDMLPRHGFLIPLWERAQGVFTGRYHRRRPAAPSEVLALVAFTDHALEYLENGNGGVPWLKHKLGCYCHPAHALNAEGPGRCNCGLTHLHYAMKNLERTISERSGK